jgi:hypothetical protein
VNGGVFGLRFLVVHNKILCLAHVEGEVVVLAPNCQVNALLLVGCLIVSDQTYNRLVISTLNDGVGVMAATQSWVKRVYSRGTEHTLT